MGLDTLVEYGTDLVSHAMSIRGHFRKNSFLHLLFYVDSLDIAAISLRPVNEGVLALVGTDRHDAGHMGGDIGLRKPADFNLGAGR